jgi:hypothetical protein
MLAKLISSTKEFVLGNLISDFVYGCHKHPTDLIKCIPQDQLDRFVRWPRLLVAVLR